MIWVSIIRGQGYRERDPDTSVRAESSEAHGFKPLPFRSRHTVITPTKKSFVKHINLLLIKQGHLVWLLSAYNIFIGLFISGFDPVVYSISHVALEAPFFAYSHRLADILIGVSMCVFAMGCGMAFRRLWSVTTVCTLLLGISMISAGIWTLESPLHLLYGLSIFMILMPLAFAYELDGQIGSARFKQACKVLSLIHCSMFWLIYAGFIPSEYNGLIQRIWAVPTMAWFGWAVIALNTQIKSVRRMRAQPVLE